MVGTPQLPLRYRRKGVRDYWVFTQHCDMQSHYSTSSNSCMSGLEYSMPRSPSFYSSSSSIAPSSPIRSLYTPEPTSPTLPQPLIASSPKSPRPQGRKGFWEVALNYCPDPPYMKQFTEQNTDHDRGQLLTRRRSSSSCAPTLVSDIELSDYSEDYDPLHIDDATDEENPSNVTVINSREEFAHDRPRVSHLSRDDIDETSDDNLLAGEIDVAAVLLDLSRQVRFGSIESKVENIVVGPASASPINLAQQPASVSGEYSGTDQESIITLPVTLENDVHISSCDDFHDIQVTCLDKEEARRQGTDLEVVEPRSEASHTVSDVYVSMSVAENGPCSTAEPKPLQDDDPSSENVAIGNVDNALKSNNQDYTCSELEAASCTIDRDKKQDMNTTVDAALSDFSVLTPVSSPVSVLSELSEPLSGISSPGCHALELTGPCNDVVRSVENDGLKMAPRSSSPVPGPSGHKLGAVDLRDLRTRVYGNKSQAPVKKSRRRKMLETKTEEADRQQPEGAKRARSKTLTGSRPSSSSPFSSCSDLPRPRKKRSKRSTEDSSAQHEDVSAQSSPLRLASAGTLPAHTASSSSTSQDLKIDTELLPVAVDDSADTKSELHGCLIQAMALSRASSMPASSLVRDVLRENPHLSNQRSKEDLLKLALLVLHSHDVFGRIDREGLDADDKPLETQWFYIPENDSDQERASLLREMMPKKRNETKKHKQYFFKPLGKISRWDPEDAP